jgi:hypothetical protein
MMFLVIFVTSLVQDVLEVVLGVVLVAQEAVLVLVPAFAVIIVGLPVPRAVE